MNQLIRMLLAGMVFAAMATSPTHAGTMMSTGSMTTATTFIVTTGGYNGVGGAIVRPLYAMNSNVPATNASTTAVTVKSTVALTESQLTEIRAWIISELAKLGRGHAFAQDVGSKLTAEDLAVLAANPKMMQPAGRLTTQQENLLWAALIVAGIVALILVADSSSVTVNA